MNTIPATSCKQPIDRFNIYATPEFRQQTAELQKLLSAAHQSEAIRRAVNLALRIAREQEGGSKLYFERDGSTKQLIVL